jgi:hypothetical protein
MNIREIFNGLRIQKFQNRIFHNCEGQSQLHSFPWHPTLCWRCQRWKQTALAQVPEETVVQKQLTVQPSSLTVSSFGQQKSCNRTYGRTTYIQYKVRFLLQMCWGCVSFQAQFYDTYIHTLQSQNPFTHWLGFSNQSSVQNHIVLYNLSHTISFPLLACQCEVTRASSWLCRIHSSL